MYSPCWGRFLQVDTVGYAGGSNLYAYIGNDPLNSTDSNGNCFQCAAALVGAGIGVGVQAGLDIWHGQLSSWQIYAGAAVGGAVGGVAATTCGPACAGAAASAAANLVTNGLSGTINPVGLAVDATAGAITGGVLGVAVPYVFKNFVSIATKGDIGEALTALGLTASGESFESEVRVSPNFGNAIMDFQLTDSLTYIESKFGTSGLTSAQRDAIANGANVEVQQWSYPTISGMGAAGVSAGGAANMSGSSK
jgi:small basic protein